MMRMRTKASLATTAAYVPLKESLVTVTATAATASGDDEAAVQWEVRPSGMLVQKRDPDKIAAAAPTIRVRVKYGAAHHEVPICSQATFGELKKLLSEQTGLHPEDQKLVFRNRERSSTAFLDTSGVKDRSKMVLLEDPAAQARRLLEARRAARTDQASKSISQISLDVDGLAPKVSALEATVSKGRKVAEKDVLDLIELLMVQLVKLEGIDGEGDVKIQRRMQEKRVQKYVETLDVLKIKNAALKTDAVAQQQPHGEQQRRPLVVSATKWEMFDSLFSPTAASSLSSSGTAAPAPAGRPTPRFNWELF